MTALRTRLVNLAVVLCFGCSATTSDPPDAISVLFVGNSYIYFNNLPGIIEGIAQAVEGPVVRTRSHTHGGGTLREHLDHGHVATILRRGLWDHVVLQEQSTLGTELADTVSGQLGDPASFHDATRALVMIIREQGATPLLYMTWAKQRFPTQIADLADAYGAIGTDLAVPVAPVGVAWERVLRERPKLGLFLGDGSHPNAAGSYLAACVIYAMLTGRTPVGAPSEIIGTPWNFSGVMSSKTPTVLASLAAEDARYLQQVAWETVLAGRTP